MLVVTATHFLDRMLAWFGYPDQVEYTDDAIDGPEANCWARFRFDQDGHELVGEIRLSKALALKGGVVLDTERGRVVLGESPHAPLVLIPAGHDDLRHELTSDSGSIGALSPGQAQLEDFVRACHGGPPPLVGAEQALQSMRLLEALYACRTPLETDLYRAKPEADERKTTCGP